MRSFRGTWRALLMHLHTQHYLDELEPEEKDEYDAMSDEQLLESFEQSNGDGQPFYMVWCVEDDELVIGAERG